MDKIPYASFWKEEPPKLKQAWRPTDGVRKRLQMFWAFQLFLLVCIVFVGFKLITESKRLPEIYAKLPNGLMFLTKSEPFVMDRLARVGLVNDTLMLLYYQEGKDNYLGLLTQVKKPILARFANEEHSGDVRDNSTVQLNIVESFQTRFNGKLGLFEAMTKGNLIKRTSKTATEAPLYVKTLWAFIGQGYVLTKLEEVKPGDYYESFLQEKNRLATLKPEELKRELDVNQNFEIPIKARNTSLF